MGSSRPNWARRFMRTSGGTFGLVASSSKGSPGAIARMVKSTRLIPASTGMMIRRRRTRYLVIEAAGGGPGPAGPGPAAPRLSLAVPVLHAPEGGVPAALLRAQRVGDGGHAGTEHHRDDHDVLDDQFVHPDEERCPLDRIELGLGRLVELVVLLVSPAGDVAALPLVVLGGDLLGQELAHEQLGVRLRHGGRVH